MSANEPHAEILAALPHDFVRRMNNWARSFEGGRVSTSSIEERVDHWRHEHPIPVLMGEADDTHRAVQALTQPYQDIVTVFWTHRARTLAWMSTSTEYIRAWRLGKASFEEWLKVGHGLLQAELTRQTRSQAKRFESARP